LSGISTSLFLWGLHPPRLPLRNPAQSTRDHRYPELRNKSIFRQRRKLDCGPRGRKTVSFQLRGIRLLQASWHAGLYRDPQWRSSRIGRIPSGPRRIGLITASWFRLPPLGDLRSCQIRSLSAALLCAICNWSGGARIQLAERLRTIFGESETTPSRSKPPSRNRNHQGSNRFAYIPAAARRLWGIHLSLWRGFSACASAQTQNRAADAALESSSLL